MIQIRWTVDEVFSPPMSISDMFYNSRFGELNYIQHGENSFTITKKVRNTLLNVCNDLHLLPPVLIKNSLPVQLEFDINRTQIYILKP